MAKRVWAYFAKRVWAYFATPTKKSHIMADILGLLVNRDNHMTFLQIYYVQIN